MSVDEMPDWVAKFQIERDRYQRFGQRLHNLLSDLLRQKGLEPASVEHRAKSVESFQEKLTRKQGRYTDPFVDMTDLVGVRVITYYREDIEPVGQLIANEFLVDNENSIDKRVPLDVDRFGYQSIHYIVSLSRARLDLPEWAEFAGIKAEIQVRTVLQHAWAAVEHKVNYKAATQAPPELRRRLYALSALFEIADEQFSHVHLEQAKLADEYVDALRDNSFDIPLNYSSLSAYLDSHETPAKLEQRMVELGNSLLKRSRKNNRQIDESRFELAMLLESLGIATLSDLDTLLQSDLARVMEKIGKFARWHDSSVPFAEILQEALLARLRLTEDGLLSYSYPPEYWEPYQRNVQRLDSD